MASYYLTSYYLTSYNLTGYYLTGYYLTGQTINIKPGSLVQITVVNFHNKICSALQNKELIIN